MTQREDGVTIGGISFKYDQPDISVDTSNRFIEHQPVGGVTVRQKVGEDPAEVNVNGVCTTEEANQIDQLRFEDVVMFTSHRVSSMQVQVASTSTEPFSEGGAVDRDGEFTHRFSIKLVEVE